VKAKNRNRSFQIHAIRYYLKTDVHVGGFHVVEVPDAKVIVLMTIICLGRTKLTHNTAMACAEDAHVGDTSEVFLTIQGVPSAIEDVVEGIMQRPFIDGVYMTLILLWPSK